MKSVNKYVACTPFESTEVKVEVRGGLPIVKQKHDLYKLRVVYDTDDGAYLAGDLVYVRGDVMRQPQGKEVFEIEGDEPFILLPYEFIKTVHREQRSEFKLFQDKVKPVPTSIPGPGVPITP